MRMKAWAVSVLIILVVAGCAVVPPPPDPYRVPRGELKEKVKKVALVPVYFSWEVNDPGGAKARIEALVTGKLEHAGFSVLPSTIYDGLWRPMVVDMGGIYDRMTGRRDAAKAKLVREHTLRELRRRDGCDAVLYLSVVDVIAAMGDGRATWDGVFEIFESRGFHGKVRALSLAVTLTDTDGVELYSQRGGLQTVERLDRWGRSGYLSKAVLLIEDNLLVRAVDLCLAGLSEKVNTGGR
jgi:hypothetical protein